MSRKIYNEFRLIRIQIAHYTENKPSKENDEKVLNAALQNIPEIHQSDSGLYFTGGNYIGDIIDRMHFVHREMQDKIEEKEKQAFVNG